MGSTAIVTFSVRPQVVHSKVRSSNPRELGVMRAKAILCLQTGHIGRSFGELIRLPQRWMCILYAGLGAAFNHDRNGTVAGELVQRAVRKCRPAWPRLQAPDPQRRGRAQESRFAGANDDEFYRRQAREAEEQAQRARNDLDRQPWLWISRGWRGLLRRRPQSDDDSKPEK
jgi:hypothetical protein